MESLLNVTNLIARNLRRNAQTLKWRSRFLVLTKRITANGDENVANRPLTPTAEEQQEEEQQESILSCLDMVVYHLVTLNSVGSGLANNRELRPSTVTKVRDSWSHC